MMIDVGQKQKLPSIDVPKSGHPKTMLTSKGLVTTSIFGANRGLVDSICKTSKRE